jgi:hypothetical protein
VNQETLVSDSKRVVDGPHLMVDLIKRKRHVEGFGGGG